jgi:hypothetical protein
MRFRFFVRLWILCSAAASYAPSWAGDILQFVPGDAANTREDKMPNGVQFSFDVSRKYPELGWSLAAGDGLGKADWLKCSGKNLGAWKAFGDRTRSQPRLVHRYVLVYSKPGRALVVFGEYFSRMPDGGFPLSIQPDSSDQYVKILEVNGSQDEIKKVKKVYGAICNK